MRNLLIPLAGLIIPVGVVSLIFDAAASWFSVGLILIGVILARAINKDVEMERLAADTLDESGPAGGSDDEDGAVGVLAVADGDDAGDVVEDLDAAAAVAVAVRALAPRAAPGKSYATSTQSPPSPSL